MILQDIWNLCEDEIFLVTSTDILFNMYKDFDERVDLANAAEIRRNNLYNYLQSFKRKPEFLIIAEAPGPWGCRFSGVALTSEYQLVYNKLPFHGQLSSRKEPAIDVKKTAPYRSNTSDQFWEVMLPFHENIFVWNCVPFHPHKIGRILNPIRNPSTNEVKQFSDILVKLRDILGPKKILSVGKTSFNALEKLHIESRYIRHPSRGGFKKFKEEILNEVRKP
jgi:hypothetical protein